MPLLILVAVGCRNRGTKVTVINPGGFDRADELAEVPLDRLLSLRKGYAYRVENARGEVVPSQQTTDEETLVFPCGLKAGETGIFYITAGPDTVTGEPKTFSRHVMERKGDMAWENDRVAFRIYDTALIATDGPSTGIDLWYKRTGRLVIDDWYENDLAGVASYHEDHGEGLDDYKVGRSLGAGAMAPFIGDTLWLNRNFTAIRGMDISAQPLRTVFYADYPDLRIGDKRIGEVRRFSLDAGSQLTRVTQAYGVSESMPVAAGIVRRDNDSVILSSDGTYIIHIEPATPRADRVFIGLLFPEGIKRTADHTYRIVNEKTGRPEEYTHFLCISDYVPGQPFTYYTGYGWSEFGFPSVSDFQEYMDNFSARLKQPLIVDIE